MLEHLLPIRHVERDGAVGEKLLPDDVRPCERLFLAAVRAGDEAPALVAGVVLATDAALALDGRRARPDELGAADVAVGRGAFLGELQRVAFIAGARRPLVELVAGDDAARARGEIARRVRADKVELRTRRLLVQDGVGVLPSARRLDEGA